MASALARARERLAARKKALTAAKKAVTVAAAKVAESARTVKRLAAKEKKPSPWMPGVVKDPVKSIGGFVQAPARGILHTTQGSSMAGADRALKAAGSCPHFLVGPAGEIKQYRPVTDAATTLEHPPGTPETNRMHAIQIEVAGFASKPNWPEKQKQAVARVMAFCKTAGVPLSSTVAFQDSKHVKRFAAVQWKTFSGWCGHQHVPDQPSGHWDPGKVDIQDLLARARKLV